MTLVQGELRLVTDAPAEVSQVWVQASKERLHGTGMVTTERASEQVTNGVVSFNALPGAAVMVLLVNGIPSTTVKLLIPDKANATLRECIEAVGLADDGELDALEELALEVSRIAAQIASADRLEVWASETAAAAAQAQASKDDANDAANRAGVHESNAKQAESNSRSAELGAKNAETNAQSAAGRAAAAASGVRGELEGFAEEASISADSAADSAREAKTHEIGALSAAERAEFAAEETIQQVEGDFVTRNALQALADNLDTFQTRIRERGEWEAREVYAPGDIVTRNDSRWLGVQIVEELPERKNLIPNPRFVDNRAGWTAGAGVSMTVDGTSLVVDFTEDKNIGVSVFLHPLVDASGTVASGSYTVYNPGESPVSLRIQLVRTGSGSKFEDVIVEPGATSVLSIENTDTSMADTMRCYISGGPGGVPAGTQIVVSKPILEPAETVGEYFDGSFDDVDDSTGSITYSWDGEENNSSSTVTGQVVTPLTGKPGESETWVLTGRISMLEDPTQPEQNRLSPPESIPAPEHVTRYISDLSSDGLTILGVTGWHIRVSTDEAKSWNVVSNFSELGMQLPRTCRWLPDGEIIVNTNGIDGGPQRIYRSKGADWGRGEPTWEHVFTFLAAGGPAHGWSWSIYENIVLVAAYGSKDGVDNARHVYLSTDMGRSFRMVHELPNDAGIHQHGVAWDPYWDRIWLTFGDDKDGWKFSDDLGETWHFAKYDDYASAPMQAVGIYPTKDAILFATDGHPNGLWRIPRSQGKHTGFYEPEVAFKFNDQTQITHLCHAIYQRSPDHPVLFGYGAETQAMPSRVIATHDGYEVCDVWEDTYISAAGRGLRSLVGPTARGNLIWEKQDAEHGGSGRFRYTVPWPGGY